MVDFAMIKSYAEGGSPHPCNSCYICMPNGFQSDEDKKSCNERLAMFGMIEQKVIAYKKIEQYIKKCDYTWTVESLLKEFQKQLLGSYISYTAEDCIKNNRDSFNILSTLA